MATAQNQAPNTDLFDAYFQRADLDRDGRISAAEAVAFFQGSGLSKQVLAQIWALADPRQIGFLGRSEFFNALKLTTVAQKKWELTPEIVKTALYGPASAKIPAPQINVTAMPPSQLNIAAGSTASQIGASTPTSSQNIAFRGPQVAPAVGINQQQVSFQPNQLIRAPESTSMTNSMPVQIIGAQGFPESGIVGRNSSPGTSVSTDWVGGRVGVQGIPSQVPDKGVVSSASQLGLGVSTSASTASLPPRPPPSGIRPSGPPTKDSRIVGISGNGVASNSFFGDDVFSATPPPLRQDSSAGGILSANIPRPPGIHSSLRPSVDSTGSSFTKQPDGGHLKQPPVVFRSNQQVLTHPSLSGPSPGSEISVSSQSPHPWPSMTQNDVQKYTKVFVEVDKDRDGKITGAEARDLFLSWRMPREILKQVWDLSDQDNDSMLSLREFCIALYLMERYREGRPLPAAFPSNVMPHFLNSTPMTNYNSAAWGPRSGIEFQQRKGVSASDTHSARDTGVTVRPSILPSVPSADEGLQIKEQKSKVPVLEKHLVNQLSTEEQNSLNMKFQDATDAEKKVEELEKENLESKEKIEFYRSKMQELILYKSRCDNRFNEITERVSADKREADSLAKKYEEKYKQIGDVASKLTIEEATFRDIQERKMEYYQAIIKLDQDGNADNIQVRADRVQSDIDELVKILNERCKTYGLRTKPTTLTELPFGWQPGIQESSADWDEEWDKFDDEGFTFVKELTLDVQNVLAPPKQKSKSIQNEQSLAADNPGLAALSDAEANGEKHHVTDEAVVVNGTNNTKSEPESVKSVPSSPVGSSATESPREFSDSIFIKTAGFDVSPRNKEIQSDHGGTGSPYFEDKSFDEPTWGSFDTNDDIDSGWGFNTVNLTKDLGHASSSSTNDYFFESGDLGLNPIRTDVSQSNAFGQKKGGFSFDESVPSTPLFSSSNSPHGSEHNFDSFSRFDSFGMHDSGLFSQRETLARFDSMRSSKDFDHGQRFPPLDDSDPFGSSGPFRTSQENQTPRRGSDNWSAF